MADDRLISTAVLAAEHVLGVSPGYSVLHRRRFWLTLAMLMKKVPPGHDARVADVGVWPGYQSVALDNAGYRVTGYDLDPSRIQSLPFPVIQQNFNQEPEMKSESGAFDAVVATEIIEHLAPSVMPRFISGLRTALAPNSWMLLTTPNRHYLGSLLRSRAHGTDVEGHGHTYEYSPGEIRKLFTDGWAEVHVGTVDAYRGVGVISTTEYYQPLWQWWRFPRKAHNLMKFGLGLVQQLFPPMRDTIMVMVRRGPD